MRTTVLTAAFLFCCASLPAETIYIPSDYPSIQAGLDAAGAGDTIEVASGTYHENLIWPQTIGLKVFGSGIDSCVIDGDSLGSVIRIQGFDNYPIDSTTVLRDFTVRNGFVTGPSEPGYGGGIFLSDASPRLEQLEIRDNHAENGGGIFCLGAEPILHHLIIRDNVAADFGGGMAASFSNILVTGSIIESNSAVSEGGGCFFYTSNPVFLGVQFLNNTSLHGGGLAATGWSNVEMIDATFVYNLAGLDGGAIYCNMANVTLAGVSIHHNHAGQYGGGVSGYFGGISPSIGLRSSIYLNSSDFPRGHDIYLIGPNEPIPLPLDTFSVMIPTDLYAYPEDALEFDIRNFALPQTQANLYVSPFGSDENGGLNENDPLKTISYALSIIGATEIDPHRIYLDAGYYSPSATGETFPLYLIDFVSVIGASDSATILDAERTANLFWGQRNEEVSLANMTLQGGQSQNGGAIYLTDSDNILTNLIIRDNIAELNGGGMLLTSTTARLVDIIVSNNSAGTRGGGLYSVECSPEILNCSFLENTAGDGGGMCFRFHGDDRIEFDEVEVSGNYATSHGGGVYFDYNTWVNSHGLTVSNNTADEGGGIWSDGPGSADGAIIVSNTAIRGGGIYARSSFNSDFADQEISDNSAVLGGGIYIERSHLNSGIHRSARIYSNHGLQSETGIDIYVESIQSLESPIECNADLFTVLYPTTYYVHPVHLFEFDIDEAVEQQYASDVYISPEGSNDNDGLSLESPLRTIRYAQSRVNPLAPRILHLAHGVYSPETNGESFPVYMVDNISLLGESELGVILDADSSAGVLSFIYNSNTTASLMTLMGGNSANGGGIYSNHSDLVLERMSIIGNSAVTRGGGIYANQGAIAIRELTIAQNICENLGGGIYLNSCSTIINNLTFYGNTALHGGGFWGRNVEAELINTILWANTPEQIAFPHVYNMTNSINISYSDVMGGMDGIEQFENVIGWLEGNIDVDPIFCHPPGSDFHLAENSPCLGSGLSGENMGAWGAGCAVGIADDPGELSFRLMQNYPNPFNPTTMIQYELQNGTFISLQIFDLRGRLVRNLISEYQGAGLHSAQWAGDNKKGTPAAAGVYLYHLQAGDFAETRKMVLLE